MMNKEQEQKLEQIIKKSLEYFANRYDSLPSELEKAAELTAHTVFIELVCFDVMVDKIEAEVI